MQSLILTAVLLLLGTIISDLLSINRQLLEEIQYNQCKEKLNALDQNSYSGGSPL